ncbi:hypothetical protein SDC9_203999 [bioreactor metagenome]|uniref:Uncharacterized protein n=1 Tax=bioreactor metagenome TaxID=1076179 RepID=A0A645IYA0_9ZZZZ
MAIDDTAIDIGEDLRSEAADRQADAHTGQHCLDQPHGGLAGNLGFDQLPQRAAFDAGEVAREICLERIERLGVAGQSPHVGLQGNCCGMRPLALLAGVGAGKIGSFEDRTDDGAKRLLGHAVGKGQR